MNAGSAELWLDGKRIAQADGGFVPMDQLLANTIPSFVSGPADYLVEQSFIHISSNGKTVLEKKLGDASTSDPMRLFGTIDSIVQRIPVPGPDRRGSEIQVRRSPPARIRQPADRSIHAVEPGRPRHLCQPIEVFRGEVLQ